jgi:hypothetical protein
MKIKRGYDKLFLDITVDVLQNMIADSVSKGNKEDVNPIVIFFCIFFICHSSPFLKQLNLKLYLIV